MGGKFLEMRELEDGGFEVGVILSGVLLDIFGWEVSFCGLELFI